MLPRTACSRAIPGRWSLILMIYSCLAGLVQQAYSDRAACRPSPIFRQAPCPSPSASSYTPSMLGHDLLELSPDDSFILPSRPPFPYAPPRASQATYKSVVGNISRRYHAHLATLSTNCVSKRTMCLIIEMPASFLLTVLDPR